MAKQRSPNYPKFDLETAISKVDKVYKAEHTHVADKEVVARDLGYTSLNGASLTTIGALNAYGLLVNEGNGLKVSDDAVTILELPKGHAERIEALLRRANAPKLFSELHQEFGDSLPSDVNLRHSLIKRKFLPKSADEAIRVYRETKSFVYAEYQEYSEPHAGKPEAESKPAGGASMQQKQQPTSSSEQSVPANTIRFFTEDGRPLAGRPSTELAFKLSRASDVKVTIFGDATQDAIDKLIQHLNLSKDTFPTKEELDQSQSRRAATWHNKDQDQPVTVIGELGRGHDGRNYLRIVESDSGVPEDEIEFTDTKAKGAA